MISKTLHADRMNKFVPDLQSGHAQQLTDWRMPNATIFVSISPRAHPHLKGGPHEPSWFPQIGGPKIDPNIL